MNKGQTKALSVALIDLVLNATDVAQIDTKEAAYLQIGDVALIRSQNIREIGDHFILVVGAPIKTSIGLRPQTLIFNIENMGAINYHPLLDGRPYFNGVTILKLKETAKQEFYKQVRVTVENNKVSFTN